MSAVWVVTGGFDYEIDTVLAACASLDLAKSFVTGEAGTDSLRWKDGRSLGGREEWTARGHGSFSIYRVERFEVVA